MKKCMYRVILINYANEQITYKLHNFNAKEINTIPLGHLPPESKCVLDFNITCLGFKICNISLLYFRYYSRRTIFMSVKKQKTAIFGWINDL